MKRYRSVIVIWSPDDPTGKSLMDMALEADRGDSFYESLTVTIAEDSKKIPDEAAELGDEE